MAPSLTNPRRPADLDESMRRSPPPCTEPGCLPKEIARSRRWSPARWPTLVLVEAACDIQEAFGLEKALGYFNHVLAVGRAVFRSASLHPPHRPSGRVTCSRAQATKMSHLTRHLRAPVVITPKRRVGCGNGKEATR
jgi:hypothetical protein